MPLNRVVFLVGPTAVGKTRIAVELARKINAEIISCDSMQIYKGMDIITSKPQAFLRKKIKHHLIGMVLPKEEYNVSKYRQEALRKIREIIRKGKTPLFCGGTGLYVSILIDGIFKARAQNPALRKKLYRQLEKYGRDYLYKKLKRLDHKAAENIHPNDIKRTIRALEVFEATGKPISGLQKEREGLSKNYDIKIFCLNMERSALYKRIDGRVDKMFRAGLLKEARRLLKKKLSKTSRYAIGLNELAGYFEGKYDLAEAKRLIKRNSRHYAKRQLTWFRKDKRIQWFNIQGKDASAKVAGRLWKELY
ncbi:MAG: tRNA (adenosine(37)-N6)-dimethylallyltransferase MiaA [Candidatus Omnitrophica bacterium]|nr:tRNA (adenosine(37)-N6)-dimethylallyltransferase MiaA [Candidatus Omnitrophota bacterium]MDD5518763.1 tRNA (adenosine(37)-N6)-dimethylallyltransferase MiaA [Candidatus Omnitrophota bacterium]